MKGIRLVAALAITLLAIGSGIALAAQAEEQESPTALSAPPAPMPAEAVQADRTATSETFRLPDGALQTRIYETPINYQDADGNWKPIEEAFKEQGDGSGLTNGANSFDLSLPERLGAEPVRLTVEDQWVSARLVDAPSEPVEVAGNTATYDSADTGTAFELVSLPNGLKENIEIAGPNQPSSFSFLLDASPGATPALGEDGSVRFRDGDGKQVAAIPAPVISDSAPGSPQLSDAVHYALEAHGQDQWMLKVEADQTWLDAPDREWPARIDPSLIAGPSQYLTIGHDPYSTSDGWTMTGPLMYANYHPNASNPALDEGRRTLMRFNLSAIPSNAAVTAAGIGVNTDYSAINTSGVELRRPTRDWTSGANWTKYDGTNWWPEAGGGTDWIGAQVFTSQRGSQPGWWNFSNKELTGVIQGWVNGGVPNQGVQLKLIDDPVRECSTKNGKLECVQKEAGPFNSSTAVDQAKRPFLEAVYYPPAKSSSKLVSPSEGTVTARRIKLKTAWEVQGVTGVSFQYREGALSNSAPFSPIPANLLTNAKGETISWPQATQGHESEPVYLDAAHLPGYEKEGGMLEVRALFEGSPGAAGYSAATAVKVDRFTGGPQDATASVGPASVDLLTGNATITSTDVSIPGPISGLSFARTHISRNWLPTDTTVLGRGWSPSVPVEGVGGAAWRKVREVHVSAEEQAEGLNDYALLVDLEGNESAFELVNGSYESPPEFAGWVLSKINGTFVLVDSGANRTVFEKEATGNDYVPTTVTQTGGSSNTTALVYKLVGESKRLTMVIAPAAPNVVCNESTATTTPGCRSLTFTYQPATTWGAPANMGDRLSTIKYYGPSGPKSIASWEVAKYNYNAEGRLTQEWDPRISPNLKETYTYTAEGQIAKLTPPGQEPWTLEYYGSVDGDKANGRLKCVKRPSLVASPTTAQTTLVYGVPLSGSKAPYDMSQAEVAKWGQSVIPFEATAIFGPDEIPASPPTSYAKASIYYTDAEGQLVNTAAPAGGGTTAPSIVTAEPDQYGNIVRELTAQNRLRSLAEGAKSAERSRELDTKREFSSDGTEMLEEWGPLHQVRLESGTTTQARLHTTVEYDTNAPTPPGGTPWPHLPTLETTGASIKGQGIDADQRVTETKYNWTLREPTDVIVDPLGLLKLTTHIEYDETGLPIERRSPASNPAGGDPHTTRRIYYTALYNPQDASCGEKPGWAGLPCRVAPAKQPGTEGQPDLLVTKYAAYSPLGKPTEVIESPSGKEETTRKVIKTYDTAGREISTKEVGGGIALPSSKVAYNTSTGLPTERSFVCEANCEGFDSQSSVTAYDKLGRPTKYTDADGNTSTATYDLLGRASKTSDGKGTQTMSYDANSGMLVGLEDSAAGTFTASYDADGNIVERGLPNGLVAKATYDESGARIHLAYTKVKNCTTKCTWLDFGAERSIYGQVLSQTSLASSQQYSYDKAGRLTLVKDTPQGEGCTTRAYSFDADSNRTALITRDPEKSGACDTTSKGTPQTYSYDEADRLVDPEIKYDSFGRITSLPGKYAGGNKLETSFYSNEMVAIQSQAGLTNTYQLDAEGRPRQVVQSGTKEGTEIFHYALASGSTAWTERGSTWTRNIAGIDNELAAIQESSGTTSLQLTNLHGDIVATASLSSTAEEPTASFEFDEFGNPKKGAASRYRWLGGKERPTELPSGVVQMGVRSYVPAIGRFISIDPVRGGSVNAYDYANQDPVNEFDLDGRVSGCGLEVKVASYNHRIYGYADYTCNSAAWPFGHTLMKVEVRFERHTKGWWDETFIGEFETKGHWSWEPRNGSDPKWRHFKERDNWWCGDLGREYQITYLLTIMYSSPVNGVVKSSTETLTGSGRVKCLK